VADRATIARPYARAAFAHARGSKDLASWSSLLGAAAIAAGDSRVSRLIGNPHVTGDELVDLLGGLSKQAAGEGGKNFLRALAANRRLALLPEIAAQFEKLRADVEGVVDVEVIAAREIAAPQQKRLEAALAKRLGRDVRLHTRLDDSLIGGAIVRAGDLVIDGSLKGRLERLETALKNQ
jgi:F-type H+-transporting ATPase subunit delta